MIKYNKNNPLRVVTLCSGYDSQCLALKKAGIPFDLIGWSEIEKRAIDAHNLIFPEYKDRNYGDICKINWESVPDFEFFTYSSPCQSFSIAGKMLGGEEGSGTTSSLLWECKKAIDIKKPKYLMLENVKNLVSDRFIDTFNLWLKYLESKGYTNYWKVLNSCNYGIPQDRNRVFCISILNPNSDFVFPNGFKLKTNTEDYMQTKEEIGEELWNKLVEPQENIDVYLKDNSQFKKFAVEQK